MSQPARSRRWVWVLLAGVLAAAAWVGQGPDDDLLAPRAADASGKAGTSGNAREARVSRDGQPSHLARPVIAMRSLSGVEPALVSEVWWRERHAAWLQRGRGTPAAAPAGDSWDAWDPPVQATMAAAPEPAPQAPSFPHAWVGRVIDDQARAVIAGPQRTWVLGLGEVLDGQWRLDTLGERQLGFTYLPLQQTVWVSARSAASP